MSTSTPFGETEGELAFLRQHLTDTQIAEGYAFEKLTKGGYEYKDALAWAEWANIGRRTMLRGIVLADRRVRKTIQLMIDLQQ